MRLDSSRMGTAPPSHATATHIDRLILDAGGVIFPSALPQVFRDLAADARCDEQRLWTYFNATLFEAFWSGRIDISAFWTEMTAVAGRPGLPGRWQQELTTSMLTPLPWVPTIVAWTDVLPVGILSNQRAEWLEPALMNAGLGDRFDPVLISSRTGLVKPDPRAFAQLLALATPPERILYVDDRPAALAAASALGLATVAADPAGAWVASVSMQLGIGRPGAPATSPPRR